MIAALASANFSVSATAGSTAGSAAAANVQALRAREEAASREETRAPEASTVVTVSSQGAQAGQAAPRAQAQGATAQAGAAVATATQQATEADDTETISLLPNLIYAAADADQNGVVSATEDRAYNLAHPELAPRREPTPPVPDRSTDRPDADLSAYTDVARSGRGS